MPATIYAVTLGKRSFFVMRVIKKPERRIIDMDKIAESACPIAIMITIKSAIFNIDARLTIIICKSYAEISLMCRKKGALCVR